MIDDPYETARQSQERTARRRRRARAASPARQAVATSRLRSPMQRQGLAAEQHAGQFLESRGLRILAINLQCRTGEIDLVARDDRILVFVEVRERRNPRFGGAAASVSRHKQVCLLRAAQHFLPALTRTHFGGMTPPCRFDVIALEGDATQNQRLVWIKAAFSHA